jgi:hypothetical protein
MRAATELVHLSGRRSAKTIRACGSVAALRGRIHDCKLRISRHQSYQRPFATKSRHSTLGAHTARQGGEGTLPDVKLLMNARSSVWKHLHLLRSAVPIASFVGVLAMMKSIRSQTGPGMPAQPRVARPRRINSAWAIARSESCNASLKRRNSHSRCAQDAPSLRVLQCGSRRSTWSLPATIAD